eukprot:6191400-Pleurochrysis_carterae.AAC.4
MRFTGSLGEVASLQGLAHGTVIKFQRQPAGVRERRHASLNPSCRKYFGAPYAGISDRFTLRISKERACGHQCVRKERPASGGTRATPRHAKLCEFEGMCALGSFEELLAVLFGLDAVDDPPAIGAGPVAVDAHVGPHGALVETAVLRVAHVGCLHTAAAGGVTTVVQVTRTRRLYDTGRAGSVGESHCPLHILFCGVEVMSYESLLRPPPPLT